MLVKYAGKQLLLKHFLDAQDPEVLLQELQTQEHAPSSPVCHQTRHQCCQIAQADVILLGPCRCCKPLHICQMPSMQHMPTVHIWAKDHSHLHNLVACSGIRHQEN